MKQRKPTKKILTQAQRDDIKKLFKKMSLTLIQEKYPHVSRSTIYRAAKGK